MRGSAGGGARSGLIRSLVHRTGAGAIAEDVQGLSGAAHAARHREKGRRIHPAGDEEPDGHVASEVPPHALLETLAQLGRGIAKGQWLPFAARWAPVGLGAYVERGHKRDARQVGGGQFVHVGEERRAGERVDALIEELAEGSGRGSTRHAREREQGRNLRREGERAIRMRIVERLDAERVAGQHQLATILVEDREREHSLESREDVHPPRAP